MKRVMLILGLVALATTVFAAGQGESAAAAGGSQLEEVETVAYFLGEPPIGYEEVYREVNEILRNKLNATLRLNFLSWGDWSKKYPLILASGEEFDLIYAASWTRFVIHAQKEAYTALDELLPEHAPGLYAHLPEDAREQAKINGKMYMVPSTMVRARENGFLVRGDLMDKYGMSTIETLEDFGRFLDYVAENEPGIVPYHAGTNDIGNLNSILVHTEDWTYSGFAGGVFSKLDTDYSNLEEDVFAWYFTPEFEEFAHTTKEWADRGYWTRNALTNKITAKESMINGKSAATVTNLIDANNVYQQIVKSNPEWEPRWYPNAPDTLYELSSYRNDGFAVPASSTNPERALMVLEELTLNREVYDLCFYGIEGKHFTLNEDGRIVPGPEGSFAGEDISVWGFRNPDYVRYPVDVMPGYVEMEREMRERAVSNNLAAFTFNQENIKSEIAAITDVQRQYGHPLTLGMVDVDEGIAILREKLTQAGIEQVLSEARSQLKGWVR